MKQLLIGIVILGAVILTAGCATSKPRELTREEWLTTTTRVYDGVEKERVIKAAERLFRLSDGDDFKIAHYEEGLYATRNWSVYVVLAASFGTDYWKLAVIPEKKGVKASIQVNTQSQAVSPMMVSGGAWTATSMPMSGSPVMGTAIYDIFWSRMNYLLGLRQDWMTCQMADERVKSGVTWGTNEALCNSFNVKDAVP